MPSVYRVCRARTKTPEDAADAAQETVVQFLKADRSRIGNPQVWLLTVAVRSCAAIYRRRSRRPEVELTDYSGLAPGHDPSGEVVAAFSALELGRQLSLADRRLLQWLYIEGLSIEDVAQQLGVSQGNVRIMAFRARRRAQAAVNAMDEPSSESPGLD